MQKSRLPLILAVIATFGAPVLSWAGPEPIVDIPTADKNVAMGGEFKSTKDLIAQEETSKWWNINADMGYWSTYIFRGTDLTPNSAGIVYGQVAFSAKGFTIGTWAASQLGTAVVNGATAVGESGSGISPYNDPGVSLDTARQSHFKEVDVFVSYTHSFGWVDVTVGNVAFFILRSEVDRFFDLKGTTVLGFTDYAVPENETFDRLFIALSTSKIHPGGIQIVPTITYYQTVYNHGDPPRDAPGVLGPDFYGYSPDYYSLCILGFKRNDKLGGYLEGKVQAVIPIIRDRLRIEPIALVSYSAGDRSEAVTVTEECPTPPKSSSKPLYGFNHFQTGGELVLQVNEHLRFIGFGYYARHLASPTAGTEENEGWGGGKVALSF